MIDGLAAVAAGDPLAIAPDKNRLHQSLMLECVGDTAGDRGGLGVARLRHAEYGRKQQGKDQPNQ
jgi:hypothetical protein